MHRYAFFVYAQKGPINPPSVEEFAARRNWNVTEWTKQFDLGNPIAGNFYMVGFVWNLVYEIYALCFSVAMLKIEMQKLVRQRFEIFNYFMQLI
jgi:hypothetical protein